MADSVAVAVAVPDGVAEGVGVAVGVRVTVGIMSDTVIQHGETSAAVLEVSRRTLLPSLFIT